MVSLADLGSLRKTILTTTSPNEFISQWTTIFPGGIFPLIESTQKHTSELQFMKCLSEHKLAESDASRFSWARGVWQFARQTDDTSFSLTFFSENEKFTAGKPIEASFAYLIDNNSASYDFLLQIIRTAIDIEDANILSAIFTPATNVAIQYWFNEPYDDIDVGALYPVDAFVYELINIIHNAYLSRLIGNHEISTLARIVGLPYPYRVLREAQRFKEASKKLIDLVDISPYKFAHGVFKSMNPDFGTFDTLKAHAAFPYYLYDQIVELDKSLQLIGSNDKSDDTLTCAQWVRTIFVPALSYAPHLAKSHSYWALEDFYGVLTPMKACGDVLKEVAERTRLSHQTTANRGDSPYLHNRIGWTALLEPYFVFVETLVEHLSDPFTIKRAIKTLEELCKINQDLGNILGFIETRGTKCLSVLRQKAIYDNVPIN